MSEERIAKLRRLAEDDPNDELAHFSLGRALLASGEPAEAAKSLQRVIALNSRHSKAYQLLGEAQRGCGLSDLAVQTLTHGYRVAHRCGDIAPMKAMGMLLTRLGAQVPSVGEKKPAAVGQAVDEGGDFACARCGAPGPRLELEKPPFKGDLGERVLASVCQSCWTEWVAMGTKVINELRLPLYDPKAQAAYDQHMKEFLMLE